MDVYAVLRKGSTGCLRAWSWGWRARAVYRAGAGALGGLLGGPGGENRGGGVGGREEGRGAEARQRISPGRRVAAAFRWGVMGDTSLRAMVGGKITYVDLIYLNGDRFVLKDLDLSAAMDPRGELR